MACETHIFLTRGFYFSVSSFHVRSKTSNMKRLFRHSGLLMASSQLSPLQFPVFSSLKKVRNSFASIYCYKPSEASKQSFCTHASYGVAGRERQTFANPYLNQTISRNGSILEETRDQQLDVRKQKQSQLTVAVDIDEVLGSFLAALNAFIADKYFCQHQVSEFYVYDFMKVWQCTRSEADLRVHSFFKSKHFDEGILPIPGAYQSLLRIASFCELFVVTSRQNVIKEETLSWIEKHYSGIFREVHFGNHYALEGAARAKSEICRGVGAQMLIDDNPVYAMDCAKNGIEVLLFDLDNSYPWTKTLEGPEHPLITRVNNWKEVERMLQSRLSFP